MGGGHKVTPLSRALVIIIGLYLIRKSTQYVTLVTLTLPLETETKYFRFGRKSAIVG